MENYTVEQFLEDVKKEAAAIKLRATPEELARIHIDTFDPTDYKYCIYGQMTGDCTSLRAADLILACCPRYIKNGIDVNSFENFGDPVREANGDRIGGVNNGNDLRSHRLGTTLEHISALEAYILVPGAHADQIVAYLKGETETLEL